MTNPSYPPVGDNLVGDQTAGAVIPPLLNANDYADFASLDTDWFIAAAGSTIRSYLRWHVAPSITQTQTMDVNADGTTIVLPTQYLTAVNSVTPAWPGAPTLDPSTYWFDQRGWVSFSTGSTYGFGPNPSTADLWPVDTVRLFDASRKRDQRMIVNFTHGYGNLPYDIAEVAYELVMYVLEKPAGVANEVQAGPYRYRFQQFGMVLNPDQKDRLDRYKLAAVD